MRRHVAVVLERRRARRRDRGVGTRPHAGAGRGDASAELDALEGIAERRDARRHRPTRIRPFRSRARARLETGRARREAALRNTLGILQWERGAYLRRSRTTKRRSGLFALSGDRVHEGLMLNSIGVTLTRLRRYEEARTVLEEALVVNRETGERQLEAHTLASLGDVAQAGGRFEAAAEYFERSRSTRDRRSRGQGWMLCASPSGIDGDRGWPPTRARRRGAAETDDAAVGRCVEDAGESQCQEITMPRYIIERSVPGLTREESDGGRPPIGRRRWPSMPDVDGSAVTSRTPKARSTASTTRRASRRFANTRGGRACPPTASRRSSMEINPTMFV